MRKSVLALMAGAGVFALTAAAASSINVVGPISPFGGGDEAPPVCDLGGLTVHPNDDGTDVTGFTVVSGSAATADCSSAVVYIAMDDVGIGDVGGATKSKYDYYLAIEADLFTSGDGQSQPVTFANNDIKKWTTGTPWSLTATTTEPTVVAYVSGETKVVVTEDGLPTTGAWTPPTT